MGFRDDHDAALERVRALEQDKAELERRIDEVEERERAEASVREELLEAENERLRRALDAKRGSEGKSAKPARKLDLSAKAVPWHRASQALAVVTAVLLLVNGVVSTIAMTTEADWSFFAMLAAAGLGFLVGLVGLGAGGAASKHQTGAGWPESLANVYFWAFFLIWPAFGLVTVLGAVIPLWKGKTAMAGGWIGPLGRPLAMTMLFMSVHVHLVYLTLFIAD